MTYQCAIDNADYGSKILIMTLAPIGMVVVSLLCRAVVVAVYKEKMMRGATMKFTFMLLFVVLPTTSTVTNARFIDTISVDTVTSLSSPPPHPFVGIRKRKIPS